MLQLKSELVAFLNWHSRNYLLIWRLLYHETEINLESFRPADICTDRFRSRFMFWLRKFINKLKLSQLYIVLRETGNLLKICNVICKVLRFGTEYMFSKIDFLEILIYRVSIMSFPDYTHLLQENYVEYKHFFTIT